MRRLFPVPPAARIEDLVELFGNDARPSHADRPWVLSNMIASLDGQIAVDGRSGALGGPADKAAFFAFRSVPDIVLVGAGTAAAERYGPVRLDDRAVAARRAREQLDLPRLAVVSASLRLDPDLPMFGGPRPIVVTTADADATRKRRLAEVADIVEAGSGQVELATALRRLHHDGARIVLCEGGPTLNANLVADGLLDELALTVAPVMVGGDGPGIVAGLAPGRHRYELERLLEADGFLFHRFVRHG